jgi:hypothetical protein
MDLRFSAFILRQLTSSDLPPPLLDYLSALKELCVWWMLRAGFHWLANSFLNQGSSVTHPLAPLTVVVDGHTYYLTTYTNVQQTVGLWNGTEDSSQMQPMQAISESAVDVESRQKTAQCQVWFLDFKYAGMQNNGFFLRYHALTSLLLIAGKNSSGTAITSHPWAIAH